MIGLGVSLLAAACVVFAVCIRYPIIGEDYKIFLPRLFDTLKFITNEGWKIQWWTPSIGGGIPSFANPQSMQFTLPQLFTSYMPPFKACMASIFLVSCAGSLALYRVGIICFSNCISASLLSLSAVVNGFYIMHMSIGHMTFHTYPLSFVVLWALVDPKISLRGAIAVLASVIGYCTYSGSAYIMVIAGFSVIMALLVMNIDVHWRRIAVILFSGMLLGVGISLAKLLAVREFMKNFPHLFAAQPIDNWWVIPQQFFITVLLQNFSYTSHYIQSYIGILQRGFWEADQSVALIVMVLFPVGIWLFLKQRTLSAQSLIRLLCLGVLIFLSGSMITESGIFFDAIKTLPVLQAFHVGVRFTSIFILPVCLLGVAAFNYILAWKGVKFSAFCTLVTAVCLAYQYYTYVQFLPNILRLTLNDKVVEESYGAYKKQPSAAAVSCAIYGDDVMAAMLNCTSLKPYEAIFGYFLERFRSRIRVIQGPVSAIWDGHYNMNYPPAFIADGFSKLREFPRIDEQDSKNFALFISHRQPSWEVPPHLLTAVWVSLGAVVIACLLFLSHLSPVRRFTKLAKRNNPPGED